ncbi:sulfite reductase (NADPH) hemoprotein beta-component [Caldalkalibacillus uzonensis]|uniref:Sulfite reductase [NADPH] hemoprotein beta-component n=1 Tax=Caldalkalibacillus uzonensis TaxID=353224 RepID=A0ABU0CLX0_9BACI|nr:assimilatory sulfite reductase (NADPH) hemoprotein subunit [Caldalkalibacillus uzonensis]MDQ0337416.1 sulfite reductase (NADPH) hemoprotein beta-component [Caldalkalibacillus uzonensis]
MSQDRFVPTQSSTSSKAQDGPPGEMERIKRQSRYLRGTILESLQNPITGALSEEDAKLLKFHGSYQQDDRDLRDERRRQKLEPAYQFMVRVRVTGGVVTPEQWLVMDRLAQHYANGSLRLTTRQAFQLHGVLKWNLGQTINAINEALLTTLAGCGDVNRNVMCTPNPYQSEIHAEVYQWAQRISEHLCPRTKAYHEIWLNGEKVADSREENEDEEPIYGPLYLPRKFKIGLAVPPANDVDVFSQDLGFIAIIDQGQLKGFNVAVGGGLGMTYGDPKTYPQLARVIGFCPANRIVDLAEKVVMIQRDYGNRSDRKYARLKYTIDRRGIEWFTKELNQRLGWELDTTRPYHFEHNNDRYGWVKGTNGRWHLTLLIQNGRIQDWDDYPLMTGLREIAKIHTGDFRLTPNQNLIIGNVTSRKKREIEKLVKEYKLTDGKHYSALRRSSMACVALPTCGLAMAEAERYFPTLLEKLETIMEEAGLREEEIVIRMTGCPNGCARPYLGEIGFTGKAPGKYNLYLGAGFAGARLNKLYRENIGEEEIVETLRPILHRYAQERKHGERFGDFVIRAGYIQEVQSGLDFHE